MDVDCKSITDILIEILTFLKKNGESSYLSIIAPAISALLGVGLGAYLNHIYQKTRDKDRKEFEENQRLIALKNKVMFEARNACLEFISSANEIIFDLIRGRESLLELIEINEINSSETNSKKEILKSKILESCKNGYGKKYKMEFLFAKMNMLCSNFCNIYSSSMDLHSAIFLYIGEQEDDYTLAYNPKNSLALLHDVTNKSDSFMTIVRDEFIDYIAFPMPESTTNKQCS